jgi:hypothetical protein
MITPSSNTTLDFHILFNIGFLILLRPAQIDFQELKCRMGKRPHIGLPVGMPGLNSNGLLDWSGNGDTRMASFITIPVACWTARSRFTQPPSRSDKIFHPLSHPERVLFGTRPDTLKCIV